MMNKIPKEKRNKVILVWLMTLAVVAGWALMFLSWQLDAKHQAGQNLQKRQTQFVTMTNTLNRAEIIQQEMAEAEQALGTLESHMLIGDHYSWALDTLSKFKQSYEVDLPQFGQPNLTENTLLPKFPYQQVALTVAGTGYFSDLGMFIADFENRFRFARIINLDVEPNSAGGTNEREREKLNFKMDVVFLVKPKQP
jgi:hypothetical protein